jgi:ribosomal protein S27AE
MLFGDFMVDEKLEIKFCPKCGSTDYLADYPAPGKAACGDCGCEVVAIQLKPVREEIVYETARNHVCPGCGKKMGPAKPLVDDEFDGTVAVVFRCEHCGALDGYKLVSNTEIGLDYDDESFEDAEVDVATAEGKSVYSNVESKSGRAKILCVQRFGWLVDEVAKALRKKGVSQDLIDSAQQKASRYVARAGPLTDKQLRSLFSGAFFAAQDLALCGEGVFVGESLTEREAKSVFGVDRKTMRKWKRLLEAESH